MKIQSNPQVDAYLLEGCGRCDLYQTPKCKVHRWKEELQLLREIVLQSGLKEEVKWGAPCYTFSGANVIMISALKDYCVLSFMKGVLLNDTHKILQKPGENTQAGRIVKFSDVSEILAVEKHLLDYIREAIEVEKRGEKVTLKSQPEEIPAEFQEKLDNDPVVREAFDRLTPGRKRSYIIFISGARQSATRRSRVEKCVPKVMAGKGFNEY